MGKYFQTIALLLGFVCSHSPSWELCELNYCAYKVGIGLWGGVHNAKSLESANALVSLHIDANIWRKWFYFGFRGQFGLGKAWVKNPIQNTNTQATYDNISTRFALGLPINAIFSPTPTTKLIEPTFLYFILGVGENDYAYKVNMPSQERNIMGLGIAGIHALSTSWNLEYSLEYGYIYSAKYMFGSHILGTRETAKIGNNSHEIYTSLGLVQNKNGGYYMRLSGIHRVLDSSLVVNIIYPQSTQSIGMLEVGYYGF